MLIKAYGLFWRADDVDWFPGQGNRLHLFGRIGQNSPTIRVADFWRQRGIYVLYSDYGPYYVGLVREQSMGRRLRSHYDRDKHRGQWDRFSWFGFKQVLSARDQDGIHPLKEMPLMSSVPVRSIIGDLEALLIKSLGTSSNLAHMRFGIGEEWVQIPHHREDEYLTKLRPGHYRPQPAIETSARKRAYR